MTKNLLFLLSALLVVIFLSCNKDDEDDPNENKNTPPIASFTVNPETGTTETEFSFNASASFDEEDNPTELKVRWDWSDDGVWDTDFTTSKTATHKFDNPGEYTVVLEVMDTEGWTNSSSETITVEQVVPGEPCPGNEKVTDADGHVYNTVLINGKCWMRENLNTGTAISSSQNQSNNGTIEKYCYGDENTNCDDFGGLYQWNELMQYVSNEDNQGICPYGWRIPTFDELKDLRDYVDSADDLIAIGETSNSTNSTGFSALLNGYKAYIPNEFTGFEEVFKFWSTMKHLSGNASIDLTINANGSVTTESTNHQAALSVRCILDN